MSPGFCVAMLEHCSAVLALLEALKTVTYYLRLTFSLCVVVRVQIWEFRIALNKIDQTVNLTTIISRMAHGFSSKEVFCSLIRVVEIDEVFLSFVTC